MKTFYHFSQSANYFGANLVVDWEWHDYKANHYVRDGQRHDEKIGGSAKLSLEQNYTHTDTINAIRDDEWVEGSSFS